MNIYYLEAKIQNKIKDKIFLLDLNFVYNEVFNLPSCYFNIFDEGKFNKNKKMEIILNLIITTNYIKMMISTIKIFLKTMR